MGKMENESMNNNDNPGLFITIIEPTEYSWLKKLWAVLTRSTEPISDSAYKLYNKLNDSDNPNSFVCISESTDLKVIDTCTGIKYKLQNNPSKTHYEVI